MTRKGHEGILWGDGNVLGIGVVYMGVYVDQTHWTTYLRSISLYVNYTSMKDSKTNKKQ